MAVEVHKFPLQPGNRYANRDDGGDPPGGDMTTRIINLERDMTDIKVSIARVETRLAHIETNMVTKGQMAVWALIAIITVGSSFLGGLAWLVQQYLAPILAKTLV